MSDAFVLSDRFDSTAKHAFDRATVAKLAEKTKECAEFISEYAKQTRFGGHSLFYGGVDRG